MLKVLLLPLLALVGGAGGFLLRRWELSTAFETSGLAVPFAPTSVALIILSIVLALVFALLCRGAKHEFSGYGDAFCASGGWVYLLICALASANLLIAGISFLANGLLGFTLDVLHSLLGVLCILSFVCVLITALGNFRANHPKYSLALLVPAYTFCLWLVSAYQQRAADPVVLDYVYELFAIICALLGLYFAAAFSFAKAKVWRCSFFCLMSVYFSIVTLADSHDRSTLLLFVFTILYQLATAANLLHNAFSDHPRHLATESNTTQEVTPDE